jgi:hypothetical protein
MHHGEYLPSTGWSAGMASLPLKNRGGACSSRIATGFMLRKITDK